MNRDALEKADYRFRSGPYQVDGKGVITNHHEVRNAPIAAMVCAAILHE